MNHREHFLVSLEPRHADNILAGRKQVELRRRSMSVGAGATMWIYVKHPVARIVGSVRVGAIDASSPDELWQRYGSVSGLSENEFFEYFGDRDTGVALVLGARSVLEVGLSLHELRQLEGGFHPPQFFARLGPAHPVRAAVIGARSHPVARRRQRSRKTSLG